MAGRVAVLVDGAIRQLTTPDALLRAPADATVARLVGYENVLEAEAGDRGEVLVGGRATGLTCPAGAGAVTVAVWAAGVLLEPPGGPGLPATATHVSHGPGRWDVAPGGSHATARASAVRHVPADARRTFRDQAGPGARRRARRAAGARRTAPPSRRPSLKMP